MRHIVVKRSDDEDEVDAATDTHDPSVLSSNRLGIFNSLFDDLSVLSFVVFGVFLVVVVVVSSTVITVVEDESSDNDDDEHITHAGGS